MEFTSTQEKLLEHPGDATVDGFDFQMLCAKEEVPRPSGVSSTQGPDRVKEGVQLEIRGPRNTRGNGTKQ